MFPENDKKDAKKYDDDEYEYMEVDENEELEEGYEYVEVDDEDEYEYVEVDENGNEITDSTENTESNNTNVDTSESEPRPSGVDDLNPAALTNVQLEYAFLGMLFNNPKGISVYYFKYDECFFSNEVLENLYKIILFQDGEQYAPAIAKDKFNLPLEDAQSYDLKMQLKQAVAKKNFSLEHIYTELKKLQVMSYINK